MDRSRPSWRALLCALLALALLAAACGDDTDTATGGTGTDAETDAADPGRPLRISAIPDQDPDKLQRLYGVVAELLSDELGVEVEYVPVTDYAASVSLFRTGDLDLVWFGGLTGVQARLQTPGSHAIVQRDIDEKFHSVFIANTGAGIEPIDDVEGLSVLEGTRFTFGSESSTSGRLMPEYFLTQAGLSSREGFAGEVGFSGSHDKTIELVTAGSFDAGVLNEQVWESRLAEGAVDTTKVVEVFRTPAYHDYHWVVRPDVDDVFGEGFTERIAAALIELDADDPADAEILELFGADAFIPTEDANYAQIEEVGRDLGLVS